MPLDVAEKRGDFLFHLDLVRGTAIYISRFRRKKAVKPDVGISNLMSHSTGDGCNSDVLCHGVDVVYAVI